ncbi:MAG TPA: class I SAM-dependent methyltransferase [Novosphingobium sp.]|nr:class I SAM-dependent methyltransferase [Novosphingobium sp.]HMP54959.1 class I SAM-dependent methyltransferase [Novosphingobium sp.]
MDPEYHSRVRFDVLPHVRPCGRLLDFGGGDGATAARARELGLAARVGVADRVPVAHALDFAFCGDLTDPAFVDAIAAAEGPFDTILCLDVLEHLPDPWAAVARLEAMLAPGGTLIVSLPNVRHYTVSFPLLFAGRWTYGDAEVLDHTHLRFFVRQTARALVEGAGLAIDKVVPVPRQRLRDIWMLRGLGWLCESLIALQYIVVARKA